MKKVIKGIEIVYEAKKYPTRAVSLIEKMRRVCDNKRSKPSLLKHLKRK